MQARGDTGPLQKIQLHLAMNPSMTDANLADIATYIRHEWTNKVPQVATEVFTKTRAETKDQAGRPYNAATIK
jgi:hypothetical protein